MKRSPLRRRSEKTERKYEVRRALVQQLLKERPGCEACVVFAREDERATFVQRKSCDIHELVRRSQGGSILDEVNLLAVCRTCHRRIGNYPSTAERLGLSLPSWTTDEMRDEAELARRRGITPSWIADE